MTIEEFEILLVLIIVSIQLWVFGYTYKKIEQFKNIIPAVSSLNISKAFIPKVGTTPELEFNVIESNEKNSILDKILGSINIYLERNKNSVSDFNLIKDLTERNIDAVEEDINLTISIPLYLGLMGTMLGIVIGLFTMADLSDTASGKITDVQLGLGISGLLGGVKIAMIASFSGLLLTITNSGWFFKESKSKIGSRKNDFYSFIQTELLPIVNQSLGATFESLQRNLIKFNNEFTVNLNKLSGIFNTNHQALMLQDKILSNLEQIDIAEIAKYNVKVLKELQVSTKEFEKFNIHVSQLNSFVSNSKSLADRISELILRTDNFKTIADKIDSRLTESQALLEFLSKHFNQLEEYKQHVTYSLKQNEKLVLDSVAEVGHSISDTFKELKEHIENSSEAITQFTIQEIDLLGKALSENKTNLSNLQFLETISKEVTQFKNGSASQGERVKLQVEELNKSVNKSVSILYHIHNSSLSNRAKSIVSSIKGMFNGKKKNI